MPDHPLTQPATSSKMVFMTPSYSIPIPHPPQMSNKGNYIVSLSGFTRWLSNIAENEYGVEIYPGFAGAQFLLSPGADSIDASGNKVRSVQGVITNEVGLSKDYTKKASFEPGMAFRSKVTLLAEGAHGSLSKMAIGKYQLRKGAQPQTYGIGVKEVWRVDPSQYRPGEVLHTLGWPLDNKTYGGGWVYHMDEGMVSLGLVIGLDYANPYLSPYRELQVGLYLSDHSSYSHSKFAAYQTSSVLPQTPLRKLRAPGIRCSRSQRRRPSICAEAQFPRWCTDRLLRRLCKHRQDQGNAQRNEERNARCRGRLRRYPSFPCIRFRCL